MDSGCCQIYLDAPRVFTGGGIYRNWLGPGEQKGTREEMHRVGRISLLISGRFELEADGRSEECGPGDIVTIQVGQRTRVRALTPGVTIASLYFLHHAEDRFRWVDSSNVRRVDGTLLNVPMVYHSHREGPMVNRYFEVFIEATSDRGLVRIETGLDLSPAEYEEWRWRRWEAEVTFKAFLMELSLGFDRLREDLWRMLAHVRRVVQFVSRNPHRVESVSQLADMAGVSEATLQRHFRQSIGKSVKSFVLEIRLTRVLRLLATRSELSLATIARQVGFYDEFHLSKAFRKWKGVSPAAYRRQYLIQHR